VEHFIEHFELSERRACDLAGQHRSVQRHVSRRIEDPALIDRLGALARERPRFGYRRIGILLRREGFTVNHKRVYRIYSERGLAVRRKVRKRAAQAPRAMPEPSTAPNDCWSMDFLSDALADGRSLRVFGAVDDCSKLSPSLVVDVAMPTARILRALDQAIEEYGQPRAIRTDNGPEFTSRAFDAWCYERGIEHRFIRPGKPVENAFAESFNARVRDELLNQHCFSSVQHARDLCDEWRTDYNAIRPHSALGGLSPEQHLALLAGGHGPRRGERTRPSPCPPQPCQAAT
jgi:putative transposase